MTFFNESICYCHGNANLFLVLMIPDSVSINTETIHKINKDGMIRKVNLNVDAQGQEEGSF